MVLIGLGMFNALDGYLRLRRHCIDRRRELLSLDLLIFNATPLPTSLLHLLL